MCTTGTKGMSVRVHPRMHSIVRNLEQKKEILAPSLEREEIRIPVYCTFAGYE